jgi:hypothetical protein
VLGSQKKRPMRLPMRLVTIMSVTLIATAPAISQESRAQEALVASLRKGVPCQASGARPAMETNIGKATASVAEIDAALTEISANTTICSALRDAAAEIGRARAEGGTAAAASPTLPEGLSPASRDAVAAALAEAERKVNNLKFEVGPPPPIAAKGRNSGP